MVREGSHWDDRIRPWLERLVARVGAPEGHAVTRAELVDTGSALQITLSEYEDRFTGVYVTADDEADTENANTLGMTPIFEENDFLVFRKTLEHSDVVIAQDQKSSWSISLGAYADEQPVEWNQDDAPTRWMSDMIRQSEGRSP